MKILNKDSTNSAKKRSFGNFTKKGLYTLGILAVLGWASAAFTNCDSNGVREETRPDKLSDPLPKVDFPELAGAAEWSQAKVDAEMLKVVTDVCNVGETLMWQYKNDKTDKTDKKADKVNKDIIAALEYLLSDCIQNNGEKLFNRKLLFPPLCDIHSAFRNPVDRSDVHLVTSALERAVRLDQHRHLPEEKREYMHGELRDMLNKIYSGIGPLISHDPTEAIPQIQDYLLDGYIGRGVHDNAVDMSEMLLRLHTWVEDLHILGFDLNLNMNNTQ